MLLAISLLFTLHVSLPCLTSFVVLYARDLAISHFGWYFVLTGATSMLARPLLGKLSDKIGCGRSLVVAFALECVALLVMPLANNLAGVMVGGALYFMGSAIGGARILALAMEHAPAERRARAMASFTIAFPLSNGAGALFNGLVVELAGYSWMYVTAAIICASGLIITARNWTSLK
jgi:MFS family permease